MFFVFNTKRRSLRVFSTFKGVDSKDFTCFKMTTLEKELHILEIDSNRIIQECYFMKAEKENNWRHQYSLNMLNEKNEVIPAFYPTNQGKPECLAHMKKVTKILKNSDRVKM